MAGKIGKSTELWFLSLKCLIFETQLLLVPLPSSLGRFGVIMSSPKICCIPNDVLCSCDPLFLLIRVIIIYGSFFSLSLKTNTWSLYFVCFVYIGLRRHVCPNCSHQTRRLRQCQQCATTGPASCKLRYSNSAPWKPPSL